MITIDTRVKSYSAATYGKCGRVIAITDEATGRIRIRLDNGSVIKAHECDLEICR